MEKVIVTLGNRSYSISITAGLLDDVSAYAPLVAGNQAIVVTNETIAPLYLEKVQRTLQQKGIKVDSVILPDGEKFKVFQTVDSIYTRLLEKRHGRDTTLLALGGGVIGDITGFAAATYQRGVRFIQIPTSLLAMVDSSVGGKTGINHALGKNMIGAFYQPASVIVDLNCLSTLPPRELSAGLAEVIKYGIILDGSFFNWLEQNVEKVIHLDKDALIYCVRRCCELKAQVVIADEYEHSERALLNLGHTFGHAIETAMGYGNWLHGEAVSAGIIMAAYTAYHLKSFTLKDIDRIKSLLLRANLPIKGPESMSPTDYIPYMMRDKKVLAQELRLVLPTAIGHSEVRTISDCDVVTSAIRDSMV